MTDRDPIAPAESRPCDSGPSDGWEPISIWEPVEAEGTVRFERPPPSILEDHYAQRRVLPLRASDGERRIVFLGESAAAGYLYAPRLTPAGRLREILDGRPELATVDVIDLARTNETLSGLVTTARASLQLNPDLFTVFAGNNWSLLEAQDFSPYATTRRGRAAVGEILEDGELIDVARAGTRLVLERAAAAFHDLADCVGTTPVVVVVPEVNLERWEVRQPVPWLREDGVERWYAALERGRRSLEANDGRTALEAAHTMLSLDAGVAPTTYRVLGRAWQLLDRQDLAEDAYRAEVEASALATSGFLGSPRISPLEQEFLRSLGSEYGFDIVDLPALFAEHREGGAEPPPLFLDYCHLTSEGIDVAMAAVAVAAIERLAGVASHWASVRSACDTFEVPASVEARARIGAAVHTAHRSLPLHEASSQNTPAEIEHWCRAAVACDRAALETLRTLAQLRLSGAGFRGAIGAPSASEASDPSLLDPRVLDLIRGPHGLSPQHGLLWTGVDGHLICGIDRVLRELEGTGLDFSILEEPRPGDRVANRWWLEAPMEQLYPDALDRDGQRRCSHFRAAWPTTTFWTGPTPCDLELRTVLRTPWVGSCPSMVSVSMNGIEQGVVTATRAWEHRTLRLRATDFDHGLNRLTVSWPMPSAGDSGLEAARNRLQRGAEADLHPIFGELHSLSLHRG